MSEYLTSMTINYDQILRDLEVCDIVEFNRLTYSHYAFHIGDGVFVNVTGNENRSKGGTKGTKCVQTLRSIANGSACRINNLEAAKVWQAVGSLGASSVKARPRSKAIKLALKGLPVDGDGNPLQGVDNGITVPYELMGWNCERYCTYWKYDNDTGFSQQAYNGFINSTLGNAQRVLDCSAAGYFRLAEDKNVPTVVKPLCVAGGLVVKSSAVVVGTGKAVFDGATSAVVGAATGIIKLFK